MAPVQRCIPSSLCLHVRQRIDDRAYITPAQAGEMFSDVCNVFSWSVVSFVGEKETKQKVTYRLSIEDTTARRLLFPCCLKVSHDCSCYKATFTVNGRPMEARNMAIKMIIDDIRCLAKSLLPVTQADVESAGDESVVVKANNTIISDGQPTEVSTAPPVENSISDISNTSENYTFDNILNREILFDDVDVYAMDNMKHWIFPECLDKVACVPNVLPLETLMYGEYNFEIVAKINSTKFCSGLYYLSVLPDPVFLDPDYDAQKCAVQRLGCWIDVARSSSCRLEVPYEYRRAFVRNLKRGAQFMGATPAQLFKLTLAKWVGVASGSGQNVSCKLMLFFRISKAKLAGLTMQVPIAQGPIKEIARPFKTFVGMVNTADRVIDEVDSWVDGDKPVDLLNVTSVVPRPRMYFPNGRGIVDATVMRLDPTTATRVHNRVNTGGIKTLEDIARIWGYYRYFEWSADHNNGHELLTIPLDPVYFKDPTVAGQAEVVPPISYVTALCTMYTGPIEFMIRFASTEFHSGSFTVTYEYGRYSADKEEDKCQPYAFQYEVHDLGKSTEMTFTAPYVYDTPWRRVNNVQLSMSFGHDGGQEERDRSMSLAMAHEGRVVIRVVNPLKAASTVVQTIQALVFVRAAPGYRLMGPTRNANSLIGGLVHASKLKERPARRMKREVRDKKPEIVPFAVKASKQHVQEHLHPSIGKFKGVVNTGDYLVNVKKSTERNEEKLKELQKRSGELETVKRNMSELEQKYDSFQRSACNASDTAYKLIIQLMIKADEAYLRQPARQVAQYKAQNANSYVGTRVPFPGGAVKYVRQYAITAVPQPHAEVDSPYWKHLATYGLLTSRKEVIDVPVTQAPSKVYTAKNVSLSVPKDPFSILGNREKLNIMDVLRRPLLVMCNRQVLGWNEGKDISASLDKDNLYHTFAVPVMPPTASHIDGENEHDLSWDHATLVSPQLAILGMFRHWIGSMRYTIVVTKAEAPVYVSFLPNSGKVRFGDVVDAVVSVGTLAAYRGSIAGTGLITEMIIPSVNPTATIEVPFYSPNAMAVMNGNELSTSGPLRDRSDIATGHLLIYSKKGAEFDIWWEMGADASLSSFIGTPSVYPFSLGAQYDDNGPAVFRLEVGQDSGLTPTTQMLEGWWSMGSFVVNMIGLNSARQATTAVTTTAISINEMARGATALVDHTDKILTQIEVSSANVASVLESAVSRIEKDITRFFPHVSGSGIVLHAALDMWAMYKKPDPTWIATTIGRWLVTAGLVTFKSLGSVVTALTGYMRRVMVPTAQVAGKDIVDALLDVLKRIPELAALFMDSSAVGWLSQMLSFHKISQLVWTTRLFETVVKFIRYLYGIVQRLLYWWHGKTNERMRVYYMLKDKNEELDKFLGKIQFWTLAENVASLKASPRAKIDFYTTLLVARVVERAILKLPRHEQDQGLIKLISEFKRHATKISNSLTTAPVRYEPFMLKFYGKTGAGKSFIAENMIGKMLQNVGIHLQGKPTIARTAGREFWTDVDGFEAAVLVDEAGQINTADENTGIISDVFQLKSPARCNPNQASEDKKDRCINPVLCVFLCNNRDPHMNEIRDPNAYRRRFEYDIEVIAKEGVPKDYEFNHLEFKVTHKLGNTIRSAVKMDYADFEYFLLREHRAYHEKEVANVKFRTRQLLIQTNRVDEEEMVLMDPYSVFYRHLYGVERTGRTLSAEAEMEEVLAQWISKTKWSSPVDAVLTQAPVDSVEGETDIATWLAQFEPQDGIPSREFYDAVVDHPQVGAFKRNAKNVYVYSYGQRPRVLTKFDPLFEVDEENPHEFENEPEEELGDVEEPDQQEQSDARSLPPDEGESPRGESVSEIVMSVVPASPVGYDAETLNAIKVAKLVADYESRRKNLKTMTLQELKLLYKVDNVKYAHAIHEWRRRTGKGNGAPPIRGNVSKYSSFVESRNSTIHEYLGKLQSEIERIIAKVQSEQTANRVESMQLLLNVLLYKFYDYTRDMHKAFDHLRSLLDMRLGDCSLCSEVCIEVTEFCDASCEVDVCYKCLNSLVDNILTCPKCKATHANPLHDKPIWKYMMQIAYPIAEVTGVAVITMFRVVFEIFSHLVTGMMLFMPASALLASIYAPYSAYIGVGLIGFSMRYLSTVPTYIPTMACNFYHTLARNTKLVWDGVMYVCNNCVGAYKVAPAHTQYMVTPYDHYCDVVDKLEHIDLMYSVDYLKPVVKDGQCEHWILFQQAPPQAMVSHEGFEPRYEASYQKGYWVFVEDVRRVKVKNIPCTHYRCPLNNVDMVKNLLQVCFVDHLVDDTARCLIQDPDVDVLPYQLVPRLVRSRTWLGRQTKQWLRRFKNIDWWDSLTKLGQMFAKVAAFVGVVASVIYGLRKIWLYFNGGTDEGMEEVAPDEEIAQLIEQAGSSAPSGEDQRVRRVPVRRAIYKGTPVGAVAQDGTVRPIHQIMASVLTNQAAIVIEGEKGRKLLTILGVHSKYAIMPYHYMDVLEANKSKVMLIERMASNAVITYRFDRSDFVRVAGNDLMMMKLPPQCPLFKDIRKQFVSEEYLSRNQVRSNGYVVIPPTVSMLGVTVQKLRISEMIAELETRSPTGENHRVLNAIQYNFSMAGACGSVIYHDTDQSPIIGIHVAGMGHHSAGLGYGVVVTRETLDSLLDSYTADVPEVQSSDRFLGYVDDASTTLDGINVHLVGSVSKSLALQQPKETSIVPSIIAPYMAQKYGMQPKTMPAPLSRKESPYKEAGVSPFICAVENNGITGTDIPTSEADKIEHSILQAFQVIPANVVSPKVLTIDQAVVGTEDEYYDRIDLSTSPGFPFNKMKGGCQNKHDYIKIDEQTKTCQLDPELVYEMEKELEVRKQGKTYPAIFADVLKDERRKPEKALQLGGTRLVSMSPLSFTIRFRQIFLHFIAMFMFNRHSLPHAVGINPDGPEWTTLITKLKSRNSAFVWSIDFKNFGPGFHSRFGKIGYKAMWKWTCKRVLGVDEVEAWTLCQELINSTHIAHDVLYQQVCGSPSGAPPTVVINTIVNWCYMLWAYLRISKSVPVMAQDIKAKGLWKSFNDNVAFYAYGDDGIGATTPSLCAYYNARTITAELSTIGITATDSSKGAVVKPLVQYSELEFLKRGCLPHPSRSGQFLAPLSDKSVLEVALWVHKKQDMVVATQEVVWASLLNAYSRGPEFYAEWYEKLSEACMASDLQCPGLSWKDIDAAVFEPLSQQWFRMPGSGVYRELIANDNVEESSDVPPHVPSIEEVLDGKKINVENPRCAYSMGKAVEQYYRKMDNSNNK